MRAPANCVRRVQTVVHDGEGGFEPGMSSLIADQGWVLGPALMRNRTLEGGPADPLGRRCLNRGRR
jgi:hypothetical protein